LASYYLPSYSESQDKMIHITDPLLFILSEML
jgi:hypothetical protein